MELPVVLTLASAHKGVKPALCIPFAEPAINEITIGTAFLGPRARRILGSILSPPLLLPVSVTRLA
jgi:hypothetical protein